MKAQEFLDKEHYLSFSSKTQKKELKGLLLKGNSYSVNFKILEGDLDISDYSGLEQFECENNKITNLNLENNFCLKKLVCDWNKLTNLELRNNLGLECIDAHYNKIVANLNIFSHLVKLKHLSLGTTEKGSPNVWNYNDFHGSLKSLENCHNLEYLCIGQQTQIISGLEYLPLEKLIYFGCHGTVFQDMLKPFDYDILSWKLVNHPDFFNEKKRVDLIDKKIRDSQKNLTDMKEKKCFCGFYERQKKSPHLSPWHYPKCFVVADKTKRIARVGEKISILKKCYKNKVGSDWISTMKESERGIISNKCDDSSSEEETVTVVTDLVGMSRNTNPLNLSFHQEFFNRKK